MTATGSTFLQSLAPKEVAVLLQVMDTKTNKQIGIILNCGEQTVKNYVRVLLDKSGMSNRSELIVWCFHHGIVQCPCRGLKIDERVVFNGKPINMCAREDLLKALEQAREQIVCDRNLLNQVKIK